MRPVKKPAAPLREPVSGWLGLSLTAIVLTVLPLPAWSVESAYSRNIYPTLQSALTSFTNLAPLAILDLLILGAVILVIRRVFRLFGVIRTAGVVQAVWEGLRRALRAASVLTIVFLLFWGFNYRRTPLEEALKIPAAATSVADLMTAVSDANVLATRLRASTDTRTLRSYESISRDLAAPFNVAMKRLGRPALIAPGRPKYSLVLTPFFTWAGVNGMIDPFALESIVHPDLLPFERPFVLAHEWSHLEGMADEAEANAAGWLACMNGDASFAYSGSLYLIEEAGSALPRDKWQQVAKTLDPGVAADLDAIRKRLEGEKPAVQHAASQIYDRYLRANHVDDGVASYSRALTLILAPAFRDAMATYQIRRQP